MIYTVAWNLFKAKYKLNQTNNKHVYTQNKKNYIPINPLLSLVWNWGLIADTERALNVNDIGLGLWDLCAE